MMDSDFPFAHEICDHLGINRSCGFFEHTTFEVSVYNLQVFFSQIFWDLSKQNLIFSRAKKEKILKKKRVRQKMNFAKKLNLRFFFFFYDGLKMRHQPVKTVKDELLNLYLFMLSISTIEIVFFRQSKQLELNLPRVVFCSSMFLLSILITYQIIALVSTTNGKKRKWRNLVEIWNSFGPVLNLGQIFFCGLSALD